MRIISIITCVFVYFLLSQSIYASEINSPLGYWKTTDDVSGQQKSILQITESPNRLLSGKVIKVFGDKTKLCTECSGEKKNQPILGMVVMEGLRQSRDNASLWSNGEILDPRNGKTYHCNVQVIDHGQKLLVRGYIGAPLFGRTQTWVRVTDSQSS